MFQIFLPFTTMWNSKDALEIGLVSLKRTAFFKQQVRKLSER